MKQILIGYLLVVAVLPLAAQETSPEAEIRKLEEQERRAVLKNDTAALRKLWDKFLIENAPENKIVLRSEDLSSAVIPGNATYSSFTREVEQVLVRGDVVFCMGSEVVMPASDNPREGDEIRRRYTNIWMKQNNTWVLAGRHVSNICEKKK